MRSRTEQFEPTQPGRIGAKLLHSSRPDQRKAPCAIATDCHSAYNVNHTVVRHKTQSEESCHTDSCSSRHAAQAAAPTARHPAQKQELARQNQRNVALQRLAGRKHGDRQFQSTVSSATAGSGLQSLGASTSPRNDVAERGVTQPYPLENITNSFGTIRDAAEGHYGRAPGAPASNHLPPPLAGLPAAGDQGGHRVYGTVAAITTTTAGQSLVTDPGQGPSKHPVAPVSMCVPLSMPNDEASPSGVSAAWTTVLPGTGDEEEQARARRRHRRLVAQVSAAKQPASGLGHEQSARLAWINQQRTTCPQIDKLT